MNFRVCGQCFKKLPLTLDFFHKKREGELHWKCKNCRNYNKKRYDSLPEVKEHVSLYWATNCTTEEYKESRRCYHRRRRIADNNHVLLYEAAYRQLNSYKTYQSKWHKTHRSLLTAAENKRRAAKLNATPGWVDVALLKTVYINCPRGMTVDHIIPLQGKTVCGLHVPWNLQYLTASENSRKSNKLLAVT